MKKKDVRILDLAFGSGRRAVALARYGFSVIRKDKSIAMIEAANAQAKAENTPLWNSY